MGRIALAAVAASLILAPGAAAQPADPAATLARWTAADPEQPAPVLDARALACRGRPWSCECGGLPWTPAPHAQNRARVGERLLACVENRLHRRDHPRGRLDIELRVAPSGEVMAARVVEDEVEDARLTACVRAALMRLRFDPIRRGERVIRFPVIFAPPG